FRKNVSAASQPVSFRKTLPVDHSDFLARQSQRCRCAATQYRNPPCFANFRRIRRTNHKQVRDRPQRSEVLDWLLGWSIFTKPDRFVREDVNHLHFRERSQPNRGSHEIREREERSTKRNQTAGQRNACESRAHRVFAHAEVQYATVVSTCFETV